MHVKWFNFNVEKYNSLRMYFCVNNKYSALLRKAKKKKKMNQHNWI